MTESPPPSPSLVGSFVSTGPSRRPSPFWAARPAPGGTRWCWRCSLVFFILRGMNRAQSQAAAISQVYALERGLGAYRALLLGQYLGIAE